jgi:predicted transcriptional regulator YdeE
MKGRMMDPKIISKAGFKVIGIESRINIKEADYEAIWLKKFKSRQSDITPLANGNGDYGIFHKFYEDGLIGYLVGSEVSDVANIPEGLNLLNIPEAKYAVFECNSQTIGKTWPYIHETWLPQSSEYAMGNSPVFEFYPKGYAQEAESILIHIAVRKKN